MNIKDLGILNRKFGKSVVHVEAPHLFGKRLIEHAKKRKLKCYCISPTNYEYVDSSFGLKSEKELSESCKQIYSELKRLGANLQLHVHLSMFPKVLPYERKKELIKQSYNFFVKELKIIPKEIVFGWFAYDSESKQIVEELGLKIIDRHFHIYDWWLK